MNKKNKIINSTSKASSENFDVDYFDASKEEMENKFKENLSVLNEVIAKSKEKIESCFPPEINAIQDILLNNNAEFTSTIIEKVDKILLSNAAAFGVPFNQIAAMFCISENSLTMLLKVSKEHELAYRFGISKGYYAVSKTLFEKAVEGDKVALKYFLELAKSNVVPEITRDTKTLDKDMPSKEKLSKIVELFSKSKYINNMN